jgi:hypothetical protein
MLPVSLNDPFLLALRYSLTFIYLTVSLAFPFLVAILVSNIQYQRDLLSVNLFLIMNINLQYIGVVLHLYDFQDKFENKPFKSSHCRQYNQQKEHEA